MTLHRSHEDTTHDMTTGIPLPMPVIEGENPLRARVEELEAALQKVIDTYHDDYDDPSQNTKSIIEWHTVMAKAIHSVRPLVGR